MRSPALAFRHEMSAVSQVYISSILSSCTCYYSIAENRRTTRGVVQRQVLYLGEINDSQREAWQKAISVFDEDCKTERDIAVYTSASVLPSHAEGHGVRVRLEAMELHHPRQWGACWLAAELWQQLDLDAEERLLKEDWHQAREGVDVKLLTDEGEPTAGRQAA